MSTLTQHLSTPSNAAPAAELEQTSRTLKLPDGRFLGYAQYGDLMGNPLLFFHGFLSSRFECAEFDPIANKHNIHLIGVDRPGMGLSTFQTHRKVLDWPQDVNNLADHLKLSSFRVIGSSGGSPYALACAYALSHDRLRGVGILAGSGPWEAGTRGLPLFGRLIWNLWAWAPWAFRMMMQMSFVKAAQHSDPDELNQLWGKSMDGMSAKDRKMLENESIRQYTVDILRAAFVQGADGATRDMELLTMPWGFELEGIKFKGVKLWCGDEDVNTPLEMARYMAWRLPGSTLKIYPGETHYMTANHDRAEEIFQEMTDID